MLRKNRHRRFSRCDCGCGQVAARVQFIPSCYCGVCGWMIFEGDESLPPKPVQKAKLFEPKLFEPMDPEQLREYIDDSLRRFHDE